MHATVKKINQMLHYCDAMSDEHVLVIFRPPASGLHVGDIIEFDEETLGEPQNAVNLTMGNSFSLELYPHNLRPLRLTSMEKPVTPSVPEPMNAA